MYDPLVQTTKLDAVNLMLQTINRAPVSSITNSKLAIVNQALYVLNAETRKVQAMGWQFNTEEEVTLTPNWGAVILDSNVIDIAAESYDHDYTVRGNSGTLQVYDRESNSFTIAEPFKATVIRAFAFEDCPEAIRQYIFTKAARQFQSGTLGSQVLYQFTKEAETEALTLARHREGRRVKRNILRSGGKNVIHHRRYNPARF